MRFVPDSQELKILQSGIYGPQTPVYVENFVREEKDKGMNRLVREHMMRETILRKWKELGMTKDVIGLIMDVDEIVSRDFLRAVQVCELAEFWSTTNQTCRQPMVRLACPMFEGSPKCIHKGKAGSFARFNSPSMVIGTCIEGIGDSSKHPPVPRVYVWTRMVYNLAGERKDKENGLIIHRYQMAATVIILCTMLPILERWKAGFINMVAPAFTFTTSSFQRTS